MTYKWNIQEIGIPIGRNQIFAHQITIFENTKYTRPNQICYITLQSEEIAAYIV